MRAKLRSALAVGVEVVVGQREQQEVVGRLPDQLLADAGRVLVPVARSAHVGAAAGGAAGVEVAVEELVGRVDGVAEVRHRERAPGEPLQPQLVAPAPPVDQERGGRGADPGVAEPLEHRQRLPAQVVEVHVVDEVVHRAEEAEGPGRLERGPVLDVAPLDPVVPVHPHHPVVAGAEAGQQLRAGDRRHRGEAGDAVVDQLAALLEGGERRGLTGVDRLSQHPGMHRVYHCEDELLRHNLP